MPDATLSFTTWLKRQRRTLDLTQEEVAAKVGCALVTLQKIETGARRPSKQMAERLARTLGIPAAEQPAFIACARATYPDEAQPAPRTAARPRQAAAPAPRQHNLSQQLTSFIGREAEMGEVTRLLATTRLLTLTGAGGSGKTRLALEVAGGLVAGFPDGVWWVDLARLGDPELVPQAVAAALGLRPEAGRPLLDQLADFLQRRHLLLLQDNCEHLIAACASFADALLRSAPHLTILATSRQPLAIAGETIYRVPSLQIPDPAHPPPLPELARIEAVRLFAERGAAVSPGFSVAHDNGPAVAMICQRLDGMPLAIELAAARLKMLSVEELAARLDDRFRVLTDGSRTAPARHQTLRATMDWSYGLLEEAERVVLRRLAVFAGGWKLGAAEAICGGAGLRGEVLDLLAGLVDKSLVVAAWQGRPGHYNMLETVRQYALERLKESGDEASLRQAHADYFLALAEQAEPELFSPEQNTWLARLEEEHDNLRAAFTRLRRQDDPQPGLRLAGALWRFWEVHGHLAEGQAWLAEMLRRAGTAAEPAVRARALLGAGVCAYHQRDNAASVAQLTESLQLYRALGDRQGVARALYYSGWLALERGAFAEARALLEESAAIRREIGDRQGLSWALGRLGAIALWQGDFTTARPLLDQALALSRELNDKVAIVWWLQMLSLMLLGLGEIEQAQALAGEGALRCRELGDRRDLVGMLLTVGSAMLAMGDVDGARPHFHESLAVARDLGDKVMLSGALQAFGVFSMAESRPVEGLHAASAAHALGESIDFVPPKRSLDRTEPAVRRAFQTLGSAAAEAAWAKGRSMPLEHVIAEALGEATG